MNQTTEIKKILENNKRKERRLQMRSAGIAIAVFIFCAIWLYATSKRIENQKHEIKSLAKQRDSLASEVYIIQKTLDSVSNLSKYTVEIDFTDLKAFYGCSS